MFGMMLLFSVVLFFLGAAIGSFVNVVIYRTLEGEDWVRGRSRCDHCRKKIHWYDNIPLLSYAVLGGKSRCCHKKIPINYPVVEIIMGVLFVWWYWFGSLFFQLSSMPAQTIQRVFWLVVGVLLLMIFFADLFYMIIPDVAVGLLLIAVISYRTFLVLTGSMQSYDLLLAVMGMALTVGLIGGLWLVTRGRGMGLGDVKFAVPMALLVGWPNIVVAVFMSFILGGVVATGLLISGKKAVGQVVPFGPFLVVGTLIALVWGDALLAWYISLLG
jgi:leader peptidase (prepilin peptidase)/N-methyltransferase